MATPSVFDLASAQRIAAAVRRVEIGDRSEAPLRFPRVEQTPKPKVFRIATFSGSWPVGVTKTVQYKYVTSTPNTASVTNLFFPLPDPGGTTDCGIAKDGTAWHLVSVPFTQVSVITGVSLGAQGLQFTRATIVVASSSPLSAINISTTEC